MFTQEVIEQLQYYVYRLIDPRTGQTFYVGKGKGNRLYAHINDALKVTIQSPKNSTMLKVKKEEKKIVKLPIDKKERMC